MYYKLPKGIKTVAMAFQPPLKLLLVAALLFTVVYV